MYACAGLFVVVLTTREWRNWTQPCWGSCLEGWFWTSPLEIEGMDLTGQLSNLSESLPELLATR